MIVNISDLSVVERQHWLQHAIAPRPIGLVSSLSLKNEPNLAPFSFFNLFSTNPPVVIFSPARRIRDNSMKHTLNNIYDLREVVIHIVTYDMVQQVSLASCEYPAGVDEFEKAGFTKEPATMVKPPMVKESPVKLECKVTQVQPLGSGGGAGNLVIAEVLCMHVCESILNEKQTMIEQTKLQHAARLGADWYCKVDTTNLFKVAKPSIKLGIGIDALPEEIRGSTVLTGNDLAILASIETMPNVDVKFVYDLKELNTDQRHLLTKDLLQNGMVQDAWQVLLRSN